MVKIRLKCCECDHVIDIQKEPEENEIVSCPVCSTEYIYKAGLFTEIELDGEDYGE
jgi:hypothetical protein